MSAPKSLAHPPDNLRLFPEVPPVPSSHRTVITDDVVEAVADRCGMTGLGLYTLLARRVNKQGMCFVTVDGLAGAFACTARHIRDHLADLEANGFIQRTTRANTRGLCTGLDITLPAHLARTNYPEPTPEPTPEPSCARQIKKEVVISSYKVDAPAPKRTRTKRTTTPLPPDWEPPATLREWATAQGYTAVQIDLELLQFRNRYLHEKPESRADWTASFQNWLINGIKWGRLSAASAPPVRGRRDTGMTAEEAIALGLAQLGGQP